jgi:AhpD family alkylhydroperoxidase
VCAVALLGASVCRAEEPAPAAAARSDIVKSLGFVPGFFKSVPDTVLPGLWEELKGLQMNPNTQLPGRVKELIGLAVAAQIPCRYCTYGHVEFAKLNGASDEDLAEAIGIAGAERKTSAYLYGLQLDTSYRSELPKLMAAAKKAAPVGDAIVVVDAKSALADIERQFGFVPEFLRKLPESVLPGVWRSMKDLTLNPNTSLSAKHKALISLAVASQVPSLPCIALETEFAKLAGATEREIAEAVGMAAITRNMSTLLNGMLIDERRFDRDIDRIVATVKAAQKKQPAVTASREH